MLRRDPPSLLHDLIPGCIIWLKFRNVKGGINIEKTQKHYLDSSYSYYDICHQSNHDQLLKIIRK